MPVPPFRPPLPSPPALSLIGLVAEINLIGSWYYWHQHAASFLCDTVWFWFLLCFEAFLLLGPPILLQFLIFYWLPRWVAPALCIYADRCVSRGTQHLIFWVHIEEHAKMQCTVSQSVRVGRRIPQTPRRTPYWRRGVNVVMLVSASSAS